MALVAALALGAAPAPGTPAAAPPAPSWASPAGPVTLVLGPDGRLYSWRAGAAGLGPLPATLSQIDQTTVNSLTVSEDGRRYLVLPAVSQGGAANGRSSKVARRARDGMAVLVSSGEGPVPPWVVREIRFEGEGRHAALSPDGTRAFVVATRSTPDASPSQARFWIHELDLETGKVLASDHLDDPPSALTLDPSGTRIYLAFPERIVSYTTRPLAVSWHYRSPGANRDLSFRPGSPILYAVRKREITLFDPGLLAARAPEDRRRSADEATGVIPVPFDADSLTFARGGRVAAIHGDGNSLAFVDLEARRVVPADRLALDEQARVIRPIAFEDDGANLLVATFPQRKVLTVNPAEVPPLPDPTPWPSPSPTPSPTPGPFPSPTPSPTPGPFPSPSPTPTPPLPGPPPPAPPPPAPDPSPPIPIPTPTPPQPPPPMPTPTPPPMPTPMPTPTPPPIPSPVAGPGLAGRITGRIELVTAVVIYGPDSIVKERGRIVPESDGTWRAPLPPPGSYRVVPVGRGARPLRCEPHFQTVQVMEGARDNIDFRILGTD